MANRNRKITSIEAVNPKTGKVWTWTHGASEHMLKLIKIEGLIVTKINGRPVIDQATKDEVSKLLEGK